MLFGVDLKYLKPFAPAVKWHQVPSFKSGLVIKSLYGSTVFVGGYFLVGDRIAGCITNTSLLQFSNWCLRDTVNRDEKVRDLK